MRDSSTQRQANQRYDPKVPLASLHPHPKNPRSGDIGAIYESILANNFYGAVIAQEHTGVIIAGEHRWRAAAEAGLETVPVLFLDVTDEEAVRILLADNRTNDRASWNNPVLRELLESLNESSGTLTGSGFDSDELDAIIRDAGEPMKLEPLPVDQKREARPSIRLVFDTEEELMTFKAAGDQLRENYPHHDSLEKRLIEYLTEGLKL